MARKSRRNYIETEQPEQVPEAMGTIYRTAVYVRLSVENSGKQDEGNSIRNQIDVCREYIHSCPYLQLTEVYSDNGRTGTVFDRPAWNRLMEDVQSGKVEAVVVRDLSRFGRDYIEVGNYLERIFPVLGIRFISVKEGYDSFTCESGGESLAVSLQNLINALYSKDISRKVSTALRARQQKGVFRNRNLPYGYVWNEDGTAYAVDEEAADHVKDIFRWKLEGRSLCQIVKQLEEGNVPNPEQRKREIGLRTGSCGGSGWALSTVRGILTNPAYLGHTVHGRTVSAIYMGRKKQRTDPKEWLCHEGTHQALIAQQDFDAVKAMMEEAAAERRKKMEGSARVRAGLADLLEKKVFCKDCGRRLYYRRYKVDKSEPEVWRGSYDCSTYVRRGHETCTSHYILQETLNAKVLDAIQDQLQVALDYDRLLGLLRGGKGAENLKEKYNGAVSGISLKLNAVNQKRSRLYESYAEGILDGDEYAFAKQAYEKDHERLSRLMEEAVQRRNRFLESVSPDNSWLVMMKSAEGAAELTQELVDAMIEKVFLYENKAIEIVFKYDDVYQDMCESILEIQKSGNGRRNKKDKERGGT